MYGMYVIEMRRILPKCTQLRIRAQFFRIYISGLNHIV